MGADPPLPLERGAEGERAAVADLAGDVAGWTAWNHVRTVAALAAAGTLTLGLLAGV